MFRIALFILINCISNDNANASLIEPKSASSILTSHSTTILLQSTSLYADSVSSITIKKKKANLSFHFIAEMIIILIILIFGGIIFFQWRRRGILKEQLNKNYESLLSAYQRVKEQNKTLESAIDRNKKEVLAHKNQQDSILSKLSQSEIRFEQVFSMNPDAMMIVNYDTLDIIDLNQSAINYFDLEIPEQRPFHFSKIKSSSSKRLLAKIAATIRNHPEVVDYIITHTFSFNNQKWFSLTSQIIHFDNKNYYLISIKNITKRMRAELLLTENETRLKNLTENINDMIWLMDETLKISYVSPSIESNLGYRPEEVINRPLSSLLQHNSFIKLKGAVQESILNPSTSKTITIELDFIHKQGETQTGEFKFQLQNTGQLHWNIYGVSRDISEKIKTDIALKRNEQLYRLITNNVSDVIFTSDTSLNIKYINVAITDFLGYTPEEILELPKNRYLSQKSIDRINEELSKFFDNIFELKDLNNKLIFTDEINFISKDGGEKWGKIQINLLLDDKNFIYGLIGTIHNNTQQHQIAIYEESTNNFFKKLFYDSPIMMAIVDNLGMIQNANNAFFRKTNYLPQNITNLNIATLFSKTNLDISSQLENQKSTNAELKTADNQTIDILYDFERISINDDPEKYLIVMRDITYQVNAEKQAMIQQEQFKALSEQSPDIIARFDKNLICTYINPVVEKELLISPNDFINNKLDNVGFNEKEFTYLNDHFVEVFLSGVEKVIEFNLTINHEKRHYQSRIIPEFTDGKQVHTIMIVTRNMTEYFNAIMLMHENVKQVTIVNKAIIICNKSETKANLYKSILSLLMNELNFDGGGIYEFDINTQRANLFSEIGLNKSFAANISTITASHPNYDDVFINGLFKVLNSKSSEDSGWYKEFDIETVLYIPIPSNANVIGSINMFSKQEIEISDSSKDTLRIISQELGSSINRINAISMYKESEESYRSLVNATTDLVWKVNEHLIFSFVNDKSMDLLGYTAEELLGTSLLNTVALEEHVKIRKFLELNKTLLERFSLVDVPLIKKSGQFVHVEINGYPLIDANGKFSGYAGINRDISAKKVNEDLRQRKEVAERMAQIKQQFVSNISHELRTPLTAIIGHTEIINHKVSDIEISSHIQSIESNSKSLLRLINDILDLSKIEAGKLKLQLEPTNIIKFFNDINFTFIPLAKSKNIDFSIHIDQANFGALMIDELRLRQVVYNVVGNAIKFTDHGYVKVEVKFLNHSQEVRHTDMIITVNDSGIGIDDMLKNSIFDSFTQADGQSNKKYGGSGLGLSICKNLIELMDGSISFESKKEQGTTFRIIIPGLEISELKAKNELFNPLLVGKKITIIENKHLISSSITDVLEQNQCEINHIKISTFPKTFSYTNSDFFIINYSELHDTKECTEIITQFVPYENKTIIIKNTGEKVPNFKYKITNPINHQKLYDLMLMMLSVQYDVQDEINFQQIEIELTPLSDEIKTKIINELEDKCTPIWKKASTNNSIEQITDFEQNLFKIAKKYEIKFIKYYASEIKISLKTFDIEKIKMLLDIYPKMINYLRSH
jgi:PAS domain S-box-containing protein